jgi:hypothetical protein
MYKNSVHCIMNINFHAHKKHALPVRWDPGRHLRCGVVGGGGIEGLAAPEQQQQQPPAKEPHFQSAHSARKKTRYKNLSRPRGVCPEERRPTQQASRATGSDEATTANRPSAAPDTRASSGPAHVPALAPFSIQLIATSLFLIMRVRECSEKKKQNGSAEFDTFECGYKILSYMLVHLIFDFFNNVYIIEG